MALGRQNNFSRAEQGPGHGVSSVGLHRKGGNMQLTLVPGSRLEKALKTSGGGSCHWGGGRMEAWRPCYLHGPKSNTEKK